MSQWKEWSIPQFDGGGSLGQYGAQDYDHEAYAERARAAARLGMDRLAKQWQEALTHCKTVRVSFRSYFEIRNRVVGKQEQKDLIAACLTNLKKQAEHLEMIVKLAEEQSSKKYPDLLMINPGAGPRNS